MVRKFPSNYKYVLIFSVTLTNAKVPPSVLHGTNIDILRRETMVCPSLRGSSINP